MTPIEIQQAIETNLLGSIAVVTSNDGHHFEANVKCSAFANLSLLEQHRLVYDAIGPAVGGIIHALSLTTHVE